MRRRRLASELRRLREAAKLTNEQLASRLGWSTAKLSRYENARQRPDVGEIMDLLDALEIHGSEHDRLVTLAREANARGWWRAFGDDMSVRQRGYAELEAGAVQIRDFSQNVVPGLLQAPEYARCRLQSIRAVGAAGFDIETAVVARSERQAILTRDNPVHYAGVIDEATLRRPAAPSDVMLAQLRHILALAALPNVVVRVLTFGAATDTFLVAANTFTAYEFADPDDPEIVAIETETSDLHLGDREDVARYSLVFDKLCAAALPPDESGVFIADLMRRI